MPTEIEIEKLGAIALLKLILHLLFCLCRWHHWIYRSPAKRSRRCAYCKRKQIAYDIWAGGGDGVMRTWIDCTIADQYYRAEHREDVDLNNL